MSILKSYIANESGNFAVMFSVVGTALALGVVTAVDVIGIHSYKADLQDHLDAAALAVATGYSLQAPDDESGNGSQNALYKAAIEDALVQNGFDLNGQQPTVRIRNGVLIVSATMPYDLAFGGLLKIPQTDVAASTEVSLRGGDGGAEVVLVLDNTASMNVNGKMSALKQGARDFIDEIAENNSGTKIGLVPFARYVDVGIDKRNAPWLDVPAEYDTNRTWQQATHSGGVCHTESITRYNDGIPYTYDAEICEGQTTTYETMTTVVESRWIGCVGARSNGLHMLDDNYNTIATKIPGLLHDVPHEVTGYGADEESWCPHTISALTDDYDSLKLEVNRLYGTDRTYIPMGLIWGQRVLSPQAPFTEANPGNSERKIMILMSDGENTAYLEDIDDHESLPYVQDLTNQEQAGGVIPPNTNEDTAALCSSIKNQGVEIFTIAFQVENDVTRDLLRNCASSTNHYFNAGTNESLVETFHAISGGFESEVRIIR